MNSTVLLIILSTSIILGATSIFSIYLGKKSSKNSWATGGRSLPLYVVVGSQYATAMGGGMLVAHVGIGYSNGWAAVTYGILVAIGLSLMSIIAKWLREQEYSSIPDIIYGIFGDNKLLLLLTSILTIVVPFGWICTQLVAFGKLYSTLTGINPIVLMIVFAGISLLLVLPAGLKSVAWTDFIFGCFMIVISFIAIKLALNLGGSWNNITNIIPKEISAFPKGLFSVGFKKIVLWSLAIIPGTLTNQMYYQKIFASKEVSTVKRGLFLSGLTIISADIWAAITGMTILSLNSTLQPEEASGWFLTQVPTWFLIMYSGFLVVTIISTINGAIHSVTVNVTEDIYRKLINPEADERKIVHLSRLVAVVVAAIALVLSILFPKALEWVVSTYAISASGLLFPIFLGILCKDKNFFNAKGVIVSIIFGSIGCLLAMFIGSSIPYVVYGLLASFIGMTIGSKVFK